MSATLLKDEALPADAPAGSVSPGQSSLVGNLLAALQPHTSRERLRLKLYAALGLIDSASVFLAFILASEIWTGEVYPSRGFDMAVVLLPIFIGISVISRAYSIDVLETPKLGLQRVARALVDATIETWPLRSISIDWARSL